MIQIDFKRKEPLYSQIHSALLTKIRQGDLKPGDQLPPVRQLAQEIQVNFNTVARAYRMLDSAGVISTQHGRGTYVLEADESDLGVLSERVFLEKVRYLIQEGKELGLTLEQVKYALDNQTREGW
jgi:GntR family transcriptional regulator